MTDTPPPSGAPDPPSLPPAEEPAFPPAPAAPPPAPPPPQPKRRGVALMLAVAAVLAATLAARGSLLAGQATGGWQRAVREEIKSGVAMVEDVRYTYQDQAPDLYKIAAARFRAEAFGDEAGRRRGGLRALLLVEADAQRRLADALAESAETTFFEPGDLERYSTESGGFDAGAVLKDNRERYPDLVAIDPGVYETEADQRAGDAVGMIGAAIPVGFAFLFGALAQGFPRRRRGLVLAGWIALAGALVWAVIVEVG